MKGYLQKIWLFLLCLSVVSIASAQVKFSQTIAPSSIHADEYATLRIIVENPNGLKSIVPPQITGFEVVSGPNQESGMSSINDQVTQYIALSYVLRPTRNGRISIGSAKAIMHGKTLISNPVSIIVSGGTGQALNPQSPASFPDYVLKKGENIQDKIAKNMQLRLETDKTSVYVGEPVIASYKLYTRLKTESNLSKNPSFNGFSVIDMQQPNATDYQRGSLNGRDYNVYTIRKAQLYPLQAGKIELEQAAIDNHVYFLKPGAADKPVTLDQLFDDYNSSLDDMITENLTISSKPQTITVKPLPDAGKPVDFKGAVGKFTISASFSKKDLHANESGELIVEITGAGNLQLITAPDIAWSKGIDAFDPNMTDNIDKTTAPVSGSKRFSFSFTAPQGNFTIPPISFSYFDPSAGQYKTLHTEPLSLQVLPSIAAAQVPVSDTANAIHQDAIPSRNFRSLLVYFLAGSLVALLFSIFYFKKKKHAKPEEVAETNMSLTAAEHQIIEMAVINQQNPLEGTADCLYREDCVEFYSILNAEFKSYLAHNFSISPTEISARNINNALDKFGVDNDIMIRIQNLLQDIEWQLYTPFQQGQDRHALFSRSMELIQELNTYEVNNLAVSR